MYKYFKLTDNEKKELLGIADRLKKSVDKNLTPQALPTNVTEEDLSFAHEYNLPNEFFHFFTIERPKS
jgi:hypothetical protein